MLSNHICEMFFETRNMCFIRHAHSFVLLCFLNGTSENIKVANISISFKFVTLLWSFIRINSRLAPNQGEASLQSNAISHWLGANLESALLYVHWNVRGGCCDGLSHHCLHGWLASVQLFMLVSPWWPFCLSYYIYIHSVCCATVAFWFLYVSNVKYLMYEFESESGPFSPMNYLTFQIWWILYFCYVVPVVFGLSFHVQNSAAIALFELNLKRPWNENCDGEIVRSSFTCQK